ncbi:hypothetical protein ASD47_25060 [Caulobacter sp. Root1472]|nr:hypothetical protein ASD47_25060 [Caulobacter sp. Root1472]
MADELHAWPERQLARAPQRGALAEAIRYALGRWEALSLFLTDGRIDLDNNPVERAIRPIALGRKNHLFAGSDGGGDGSRWAVVGSLIETAKMNGVEPFAYLRDILECMVDGHPSTASTSCCLGPGRAEITSTPDRHAAAGRTQRPGRRRLER